MGCLATGFFLICSHEVASYHGVCLFFLVLSDGIPVETILHRQKVKMLPVDRSEYQRIVCDVSTYGKMHFVALGRESTFKNVFVSLSRESLQ